FLRLQPMADGGNLILRFDLPPNRSFRIEFTTDFAAWQPLDLPGNNGVPYTTGTIEIIVPLQGEKRFYRARLWEN
ncbi:MAG TPA: hypothetical protein VFG14_03105, partial [Chthoniobacteraceae bacterium]|nr:hypothetical protein [Chthoniobacteraceae bacterium]